jgi:hypothetical protein
MIKFGGTKGAVKGKRPTQRSGKRISKAEALAKEIRTSRSIATD